MSLCFLSSNAIRISPRQGVLNGVLEETVQELVQDLGVRDHEPVLRLPHMDLDIAMAGSLPRPFHSVLHVANDGCGHQGNGAVRAVAGGPALQCIPVGPHLRGEFGDLLKPPQESIEISDNTAPPGNEEALTIAPVSPCISKSRSIALSRTSKNPSHPLPAGCVSRRLFKIRNAPRITTRGVLSSWER